ncbi:putative lipoprotein [Mycoplasma haemofelis Ohio2]|uniref:Putative lipoprotein n=1 Tax=Mycoplasma haemofelis (strain Ohio2) TaxID=859194 RepID=F6FJT3_MYCHI|nr:putative lipoprotein [Mycoplasma haemofelis Ohio2]
MASKSLLSNLLLGIPPLAVCSFLLINKKESESPLDLLTKKTEEKEDKTEESKDKSDGKGDQEAKGSEEGKAKADEGSPQGTPEGSGSSEPKASEGEGTGTRGVQGQESQVTGVASAGCGCNGWGGVFSDFFD